jgi:hypothetical protein
MLKSHRAKLIQHGRKIVLNLIYSMCLTNQEFEWESHFKYEVNKMWHDCEAEEKTPLP